METADRGRVIRFRPKNETRYYYYYKLSYTAGRTEAPDILPLRVDVYVYMWVRVRAPVEKRKSDVITNCYYFYTIVGKDERNNNNNNNIHNTDSTMTTTVTRNNKLLMAASRAIDHRRA